jgi:N-acetylglucosaminyl-diphospho-decaprenol L-rhamnosyltransferase
MSPSPVADPASFQDVGVVIVTHHDAGSALLCARALSPDVERSNVVAVVNDPRRISLGAVAELRRLVGEVVLNDRCAGYGANLNAGVTRIREDPRYVLLLNDDAFVEPGAVRELRRVLEARPSAGMVGPQLVDGNGTPQPSRHKFPTLASELVAAVMLPAGIERRLARRLAEPSTSDVASGNTWPVGAALLVRVDAFRAVGGFDERYFLYSEETDLARRLRDAGWTVWSCDEALVRHVGGHSTERRHQRLLGLSRWRYLRAHWTVSAQAALVVLLPAVYLWNTAYIGARVLIAPRSRREKAQWWYARWVKRPLPDLHRSRTVVGR